MYVDADFYSNVHIRIIHSIKKKLDINQFKLKCICKNVVLAIQKIIAIKRKNIETCNNFDESQNYCSQ